MTSDLKEPNAPTQLTLHSNQPILITFSYSKEKKKSLHPSSMTDYGNSVLGATPHCTVQLSVPVVDDLNMLMHAVADDATPIIKVSLSHFVGSVTF